MNLRGIDWIWTVRGRIAVEPMQSPAGAFDKLDPMFHEKGTSYRVDGDTLSFTKKDQLPQDKMSVFDHGTLRISDGTLRYEMTSRALLACFLAPALFFGVGHIGVAIDGWRNPPELAAAKEAAEKKRSRVKAEDVPMNPIDEFLGAAKPEKKKEDKKGDEVGKRKRKPSMTTAYVFMGIFFALWVLGRILENVLIHKRMRRLLTGESLALATDEQGFRQSGYPSPRQAA
ncbi:hypothetical protein [Novosphingobium sp. 9U]|uniref:hypothetical protein n=1 Tax=Novosphingobium sp. 9U TaxID=2653158 RepID=UPI0012EFE376|nr:hypothetical protein [Novosphingobium sp. 9U]VWX46723.1 conserved hypothetical protein [Novosphingobium sp. 9U]